MHVPPPGPPASAPRPAPPRSAAGRARAAGRCRPARSPAARPPWTGSPTAGRRPARPPVDGSSCCRRPAAPPPGRSARARAGPPGPGRRPPRPAAGPAAAATVTSSAKVSTLVCSRSSAASTTPAAATAAMATPRPCIDPELSTSQADRPPGAGPAPGDQVLGRRAARRRSSGPACGRGPGRPRDDAWRPAAGCPGARARPTRPTWTKTRAASRRAAAPQLPVGGRGQVGQQRGGGVRVLDPSARRRRPRPARRPRG